MATQEVSIRTVRTSFEAGKLSLLLLFITSLMMYMLSQAARLFDALVWYAIFILFVFVYALSVSVIEGRRNFFHNLLSYDINNAWIPMMIWGVGLFVLFGFFYKTTGAAIVFPTFDVLIHQIFVASAETFIFVIFLPEAIGKSYLKLPGWFWGSGFFFATFHVFAYYTGDIYVLLYRMGIVMFMGLVFYLLYAYGLKNKNLGGTAAVICLHWNWNVWAISTAGVMAFVI